MNTLCHDTIFILTFIILGMTLIICLYYQYSSFYFLFDLLFQAKIQSNNYTTHENNTIVH